MSQDIDKDITAIFRDGTQIKRALQAAAHKAIKQHKQAALPMPVRRDGRTVFISPAPHTGSLGARTCCLGLCLNPALGPGFWVPNQAEVGTRGPVRGTRDRSVLRVLKNDLSRFLANHID